MKTLLNPRNLIIPTILCMCIAFAGSTVQVKAADVYPAGSLVYQGAIRCTDGEWFAINDEGHVPLGIKSVTATSTYVQINHVHVEPVGSVQINGDADYAMKGITVYGPSSGFDFDRVFIFKNGVRINPELACDLPSTNLWVTAFSG